MSTISAAAVNELRKRTDQPLMDCKKALTETGGDMEKAVDWLRRQNSKVGDKRALNETAEGRVGATLDAATNTAAILEMRCESAPVAKSDQFQSLVADLLKHIVSHDPKTVADLVASPFGSGTVTDRISDVIGVIRENMKVHRFARLTGGVFGEYVHHDGTLGVLIQLNGEKSNPELLRDVCAHIAALNPHYAKMEQVPADVLAKEKELALAQVQQDPKNAGKPPNILEKILEGKVKTWAGENVLLEQPIANQMKYDKKTVGQLLKSAGLEYVGHVRYKVGEVAV